MSTYERIIQIPRFRMVKDGPNFYTLLEGSKQTIPSANFIQQYLVSYAIAPVYYL